MCKLIYNGNVIFSSGQTEKKDITVKIEAKISKKYEFTVPVMVLDFTELNTVFVNNPFINNRNEDISKLHVTFLDEKPKEEFVHRTENIQSASDEFIIIGKNIYVFCPNGYGKTKLNNTYFEKKLKTTATTRNWKTVSKLVELSS